MAPTIHEDDMDAYSYRNSNRILRHRSVINYVGRQSNRENDSNDEMESSENESQGRRSRECIPYSTERRNIIKRIRETRMSYDSDDSSNSIPSPMSFHNYAKRQKFNDSEDDDEKYISTSSDSNENSVSSTISFNNDVSREGVRLHSLNYLLRPTALAPFSPVSSTTAGAMTVYCQPKASPRYINPFYRQDLMEIAMKTIILLQKNRSLYARLHQLKLETRAFVDTVMSNPENAKLRQTMNQSNEKSYDQQPLAVKNQ
ncbi:uncharacterized protein LOC129580491 [Sitodiplosis mosellana]|uniref:uncharacterized protein LOC129580491 n=1 Tax=Sitodiplosis mosellana TaxID=263140 RepID=UPI002444A0CD|nr:uncharacterized protein LOC129580491 [Sitodiplosis mosellana]XP_055326929.1 uncharacterized protein LOC129580491 [Sitodiplosis mosellana]